MRICTAALFGTLFVLSLTAAVADDKADEKLLVGKWKLTKTAPGELPEGLAIVLDVQKDGKFKLTSTQGDKKDVVAGTWKLEAKKLTVEFTEGSRKGMKQTDTVKELSEKKLVLLDANEMTEYFERIEEKKGDK